MTFHDTTALVLRASRGPQLVLLSLITLLNGCATHWKARDATPQEVLRSTGETEVQVILTTGARIILRDPGIEGDSLIGWSKPGNAQPLERYAFVLTDVRTVATKKNEVALNLSLGLLTGSAIALSLAGGIVLLCYSSGCGN